MPGSESAATQQCQSFQGTDACKVITFYLNGEKHVVSETDHYGAKSTLSQYIRDSGFTGTKLFCKESGCGACAVAVTCPSIDHPGSFITTSINSCLCPLFTIDGWQVTTSEGLGKEKDNFHPIQERIAKANGSQCGYCTPGVVMSMYGLLQENPTPSQQEIEDNFDGNLCRCTGYRAILDSMKSFAVDGDMTKGGLIDIEDLNKKLCPGTGKPCTGKGHEQSAIESCATLTQTPESKQKTLVLKSLRLELGGTLWIKPITLEELKIIVNQFQEAKVKLLAGNTGAAIFKSEGPYDIYVDISCVQELCEIKLLDSGLQVGASVTLSRLIKHLQSVQDSRPGFAYFSRLVPHLRLVGNVLLRNVASVGGNLYIKSVNPWFGSDVFTIFEAVGATVTIYDPKTASTQCVPLLDLVSNLSVKGKILVCVTLPVLDSLDHFRSFKITPRAQNTHAYVSAAFKIKLSENGQQIVGKPCLVYDGVNSKLTHASKTEEFLSGKELSTSIVQECIDLLKSELEPTPYNVFSSPEYRRDLAANLLYKSLLGLATPSDPRLASGACSLERPLSHAVQEYQEKKEERPLKQPMPKTTSLLQASGEAIFIDDMPRFQRELSASFVLSTVARARIESVDPAAALAMPGVVRYLSASDIPSHGQNIVTQWSVFDFEPEEVLSTGEVFYAGQPIGIILAESQQLADAAAKKVAVKYTDVQVPILTIEQGIAVGSFNPIGPVKPVIIGDPENALKSAKNVVSGEVSMGTQYHFYLENQISLCVPSEEGIEVYSSTQYCDMVQASVAAFLGKPTNFANVHVPRLGGGFGGKQVTSVHPAAAAALAAVTTGRPVRMNMSLADNMSLAGKRFPVLARYKAGYTDEGKLDVVVVDIYIDGGFAYSCNAMMNEVLVHMDHGYHVPNWKLTPFNVKTNKPTNLAARSPGPVPALLIIETILEHVAKQIGKHPIVVKELNLFEKDQVDLGGHVLTYCTMRDVWAKLKETAEVEKRLAEVEAFNKANQWKKRGLTMNGIKHGLFWDGSGFPAHVSIFANDGTVTVIQGGVEMGQGLYTKIAQATAHALGISIDLVKVRPNQSMIINNSMLTGGSTTSEQCVFAVQQCCKILKDRMASVREKYPEADWPTLCRKALDAKVDLGARYNNFGAPGSPRFRYFAYCAGVFETELDVLTGEFLLHRVDILYDCGESLNPLLDIGQIEGAFMMGLGCHLMEDIIYDAKTGRVLNAGTWAYNVPTTKDIPVDWRIHLLSDAPNPLGINSSKAVGEPPVAMGCGPLLALRQAMESAVEDLTGESVFIPIKSPLTVEKMQQSCNVKTNHLRL